VAKFFVSENTLACSDVFRRLSDKLKRFIKGFSRKGFLSLGNSQYERFLETELVVVLYSLDYPDKMPLYIEEYLPEFSSSELPVIVNEWREGKQIILIKTSTEAELIDLIGQLPVDFLLR